MNEKGTHFSVKEVYSPNVSPDPNSWQEARAFIDQTAWDQDDFSGLQAKLDRNAALRSRLRRRIVVAAAILILLGIGGPLAWNAATPNMQRNLKDKLPALLSPFHSDAPARADVLPVAAATAHEPLSSQPEPVEVQQESQTEGEELQDEYESAAEEAEKASSEKAPEDVEPLLLTTRPPLPVLADRPAADQERYIAYLPHSGYHNQRIEITNAILMGMMLNRTVLVPYVRLGQAVGWRPKELLQRLWNKEQKMPARIEQCRPAIPALEAGETKGVDEDCLDYNTFSQYSWSSLMDLEKTASTVPLLAREDLSFEWLTSPDGLNVPESSIYRIADPEQYEFKYYANSEVSTEETIGNYNTRVNLDTLMTPEMEAMRVIEFGSIYGSYRINLLGADPKWLKILTRIQNAMVFDLPTVERVAEDMRAQMGGRANHFGLHLRVGDGSFARAAVPHMQAAYIKALCNVFGFQTERATEMLKAAEALGPLLPAGSSGKRDQVVLDDATWSWMDADTLDSEVATEEPYADVVEVDEPAPALLLKRQESDNSTAPVPEDLMACRGELYSDPSLRVLNAHVYIATDSRQPLSDIALAPFFRTFPCAHVLDDFAELPSVQAFRRTRSAEEGVKVAKFLTPILESVMAAGSVRVVGTFGSTFSRFVVSTLYLSYWPDQSVRRAQQQALAHKLRDTVL